MAAGRFEDSCRLVGRKTDPFTEGVDGICQTRRSDVWDHGNHSADIAVGIAVEFGAADGVTFSNTRNLFLNHGWGGLLIEANPAEVKKLRAAHVDLPKVKTLVTTVVTTTRQLEATLLLEPLSVQLRLTLPETK